MSWHNRSFKLADPGPKNHRAVYAGYKAKPKKGQWYLSGAIVEAYQAPEDLTTEYPIALVLPTAQCPQER